uniref:RNA helicase n=1 Tax=Panagrellus redivivus TaxID=6233 RepID=A0A7E4V4H0_PANRE
MSDAALTDQVKEFTKFSLTSAPEPVRRFAIEMKTEVEEIRKEKMEEAAEPLKKEAEIQEFKDDIITIKSKTAFNPLRFTPGAYIYLHDVNVPFHGDRSAFCFVKSLTPFTLTAQVVRNSWRLQVLREPFVTVRSNVHHAYFNTQLEAIYFVAARESMYEKLLLAESETVDPNMMFPEFRADENIEPASIVLEKPSPVFTGEQINVIHALTRQTTTTFAISAAPGTGKTTVLVESAIRLAKAGGRVLFATASPYAADEIARVFVERGLTDKNVIFRALGNNRNIESICEESLIFSERIKFPPVLDVSNCSIVITTYMLMYKVSQINSKHFSHIFVDDAEHVGEMDAWQMLFHFGHKDIRLVFCGNPYMEAFRLHYDEDDDDPTPFHRMVGNLEYNNNPHLMLSLTESYRSHKAIVKILASLCYEDNLKSIDNDKHNSLCNWEHLPNPGFPVLFHNVDGEVKHAVNKAEAKIVTDYLTSLRSSVDDADIKLYCYTPLQKMSIRSNFETSNDFMSVLFQSIRPRVTVVSTVYNVNYEDNNDYFPDFSDDSDDDDDSQDDEQDKNNSGEKVYLRIFNPSTLNDILSPTRELVVVVGHAETLERRPAWRQFIDYCRDNKSYIESAET